MNIGDRVRLIHGKEEGIVRRVLDNKMIEVEIEDGFHIPLLKTELVVVSRDEQERFSKNTESEKTSEKRFLRPEIFAEKGLFLAFTEANERDLNLYFINNTDFYLAVTISEESSKQLKGVFGGIINPKSHAIVADYRIKDFENWPTFVVQALYFNYANYTRQLPFFKNFKAKAATFYNQKKDAPLLKRVAYVFQLDEHEAAPLDAAKIKEGMLNSNTFEAQEPAQVISKPDSIIDLHIEKLLTEHTKLKKEEILDFQIGVFEKKLDHAIATGMKEITFIHGIGNGILRDNVHKILGKNKAVQYFEDAQKEKFGYGATRVFLK